MSAGNDERRRYSRVEFQSTATVKQAELSFQAKLIDLSLNGALISTPENYSLNADLSVTIIIPLSEYAEICMQGRLVHSSSNLLGFECKSIDMESIGHLRRLIELNLNDPLAAERVLSELLQGIH